MLPTDFLIEKVIDAALEASGLTEKLGRNERIIRLQQRFGLADARSLTKFEDIYIHALMAYAFDEEGLWALLNLGMNRRSPRHWHLPELEIVNQ